MNQILTMREKRASLWDAAKKYRDSHIGNDGTMSAEDAAVYDRMVDDVDRMKKEIDRLERQEAIENEMNRPTASPILGRPESPITGEDKKGRASDSYKKAFWQNMRSKSVSHEVFNALQIGTDSEGGYLVPDEYERTLVDTFSLSCAKTVIVTHSCIPLVVARRHHLKGIPALSHFFFVLHLDCKFKAQKKPFCYSAYHAV